MRTGALILALAAAGPLAGCAQGSSASSSATTRSAIAATRHHGRHRGGQRRRRHATVVAVPARSGGGLAGSHASPKVVQPQPRPGSCHARGHGPYASPDPRCTPGAINPTATQATIGRTICVSGWTERVRPPERITEPEKFASMRAYGDGDSPRNYEYDHLVSLELGGAPNDARNLWPEPEASPNPKDSVERELHTLVCDGQMQLLRAQHIIATGWVAWARQHPRGGAASSSRPATTSRPSSPVASGPAAGPNKPISEINCSDFLTHAAAQQWFEAHGGSAANDVAGLDGNHDGQACTSLP